MPAFQDLFEKYAFHGFEKQSRLASLIGEHEWLLTEDASVTFNGDLVMPVQFLGTESAVTSTWLWADANNDMDFPDDSLGLCRNVRSLGKEFGIDEFAEDRFEIDEGFGHTLAMVSTCLGQASSYYRGPHANGAVFFAITDRRIDEQPDLDRNGFQEGFNNLMWQRGNMKKMIVSYLSDKGHIDPDFDGEEIRCKLHTNEELGFYFRETEDGGMQIGPLDA